MVDELPDTQVVFGTWEPETSAVDQSGDISSTLSRWGSSGFELGLSIGTGTLPSPYWNAPVVENSLGSLCRVHGSCLQQPLYTGSSTEKPTTMWINAITSRSDTGTKGATTVYNYRKVKYPNLNTSGCKVSIAFTNKYDRQPSQSRPTPAPPV